MLKTQILYLNLSIVFERGFNINRKLLILSHISSDFSIALYDFYGKPAVAHKTTSISFKSYDSTCKTAPIFLDVVKFSSVWLANVLATVSCFPQKNFSLQLTATVTDSVIIDRLLSPSLVRNYTTLLFRACVAGERLLVDKCVPCDTGTYLLQYDPSFQSCRSCPAEATRCERNTLVMKPGVWRRLPHSEEIFKCPMGSKSCAGGEKTGDALCARGYEGPLCAVCSSGYYANSAGTSCEVCSGHNLTSPELITAIVILMIIGVFICIYFAKVYICSSSTAIPMTVKDLIIFLFPSQKARVESGFANYVIIGKLIRLVDSLASDAKILVTTFQIICAAPFTLKLSFPEAFTNFLGVFGVLNLNFMKFLPLSCTVQMTFIDKMIGMTLIPILLSIMLLGFYFLQTRYIKEFYKKPADEELEVILWFIC